uniref:CSON001304 protein n=1 Tax=Culicoides sonorensis TaxID=179676 RepID=A0A336K165_CULSO
MKMSKNKTYCFKIVSNFFHSNDFLSYFSLLFLLSIKLEKDNLISFPVFEMPLIFLCILFFIRI